MAILLVDHLAAHELAACRKVVNLVKQAAPGFWCSELIRDYHRSRFMLHVDGPSGLPEIPERGIWPQSCCSVPITEAELMRARSANAVARLATARALFAVEELARFIADQHGFVFE